MSMKAARTEPIVSRTPRPRALAVVDIGIAVLASLISLFFMFYLIYQADLFINQALGVTLKILAVIGWFGGTAMFVLFATRDRYALYWPLIGIAAMFGFYYLVFFIASQLVA